MKTSGIYLLLKSVLLLLLWKQLCESSAEAEGTHILADLRERLQKLMEAAQRQHLSERLSTIGAGELDEDNGDDAKGERQQVLTFYPQQSYRSTNTSSSMEFILKLPWNPKYSHLNPQKICYKGIASCLRLENRGFQQKDQYSVTWMVYGARIKETMSPPLMISVIFSGNPQLRRADASRIVLEMKDRNRPYKLWRIQIPKVNRNYLKRSRRTATQRNYDTELCRLVPWVVTTKEVGFDSTIQSPKNLTINFCSGLCEWKKERQDPIFTNNAIIRNQLLRWKNRTLPAARCVPADYRNITLSFVTEGSLTYKTFTDVTVTKCACK